MVLFLNFYFASYASETTNPLSLDLARVLTGDAWYLIGVCVCMNMITVVQVKTARVKSNLESSNVKVGQLK